MPQNTHPTPTYTPPSVALLMEFEQLAVELAHMAGAAIATAVHQNLTVSYKTSAEGDTAPTNPVSEVDHRVEVMIRERLAQRLPQHGVIGEEIELQPEPGRDFIWVVDPVDGTTNFINGYPLFAVSIGLLHQGYPIAGAIWCSTSHDLRPGTYHAHHGGALYFEGRRVDNRARTQVKRRLAGDPGGSPRRAAWWDHRVTGSAAIECAFVAAGLLVATRFRRLSIWDVGAGLVLIRAAGNEAWVREHEHWVSLECLQAPSPTVENPHPTLRDWRRALIIGTPEATAILRRSGVD